MFSIQKKECKTTRLINTAFTLKALLEDNKDVMLLPLSCFNSFLTSDKTDPVSLPYVNYQPELDYHTSAVLASLIDSVTLPWRQRSQRTCMADFFNFFNAFNYKIASLQSVYPIQLEQDKYLLNYLQENDLCQSGSWFTPLCSSPSNNDAISGVFSVTCSGIPDERVKK